MAACVLPAALAPVPARATDSPPVPPAVRFEAASDGSTVELSWSAPSGPLVGFHVLRARRPDGPYAPINPWLIPVRPGGTYTFSDLAVDPGATYHYQLEAVDEGGHKFMRGPLSIAVMPEESRTLAVPTGGGYPAGGAMAAGASPGGGCAATPDGRWRDGAGLVLLLVLGLVRLRRRRGRFSPGPPMG